MPKEKKIAVRFVQKQLELAKKRLQEMREDEKRQLQLGENTDHLSGFARGVMGEIETLEHLLECCAE